MLVPSVRVSKKRLGRVLCINHYGHCRGTYTWSHLFVTVFGYRLPSLQRRISKQPWHLFAVSQTAAVGTSCSSIRSGKMPWCTDRSWARKHSSQSYRCLAIADLGAAPSKCQIDTNILRILYISCLFRPYPCHYKLFPIISSLSCYSDLTEPVLWPRWGMDEAAVSLLHSPKSQFSSHDRPGQLHWLPLQTSAVASARIGAD